MIASLRNMHELLPRFSKINANHRQTPVTDINYCKIYYELKIVTKILSELTLLCKSVDSLD